jgi:hypothetical protein
LWVASSFFAGWHGGGAWGMMKPEMVGNWHRGQMGGIWGLGPLSLLFGLIGLMFRLGFLALLVLGGLWLFYRLSGPQEMSFASRLRAMFGAMPTRAPCAHCGQPVQSNWRHCPQCGQPLPHDDEKGGGSEGAPPTETVHV